MRLFFQKRFTFDKNNPVINPNLSKLSIHFKKNHWAFCLDFWDENFYNKLINQWPKDYYFEPIKYITKSYDVGFKFDQNLKPDFIEFFPAYKQAYEALKSDNMCQIIKKVVGAKHNFKCSHILMTRSYWGSSVIPHIDSSNQKNHINLIIFINASNKINSGNLGIWKDNAFKQNIFKPKNLKNTCIMYDMSKDFYHGFEPMDFGAFRWAMAVKFVPK